jgi:DNA-binding SARP family transcriptional activator/Tfp pilus assembly protein PilF
MIELRTLGSVTLRNATQASALTAQPKRLALLIYLALADKGGVRSRDQLLAQFWPESDAVLARGALRQALHFLRRTLGDQSVVSIGDEVLAMRPDGLWCDAVEFLRAAEAGQHAEALALYAGDFLDGFHVAGVAPEFEEWVAERRRSFRRLAAGCAWADAERSREAGDPARGGELARRAASYAPGDEMAAARLMAFLDSLGDRAGALAVYDDIVRWVRNDFDADPAPETRQLAAHIRVRTIAAPDAVTSVRQPAEVSAAPEEVESASILVVRSVPAAAGVPSAAEHARGRTSASAPTRSRQAIFGGIMLVAVVTLVAAVRQRSSRALGFDSWPVAYGTTAALPTDGARHTALAQAAAQQYERGRYYWTKRGADLFTATTYFRKALDIEPLFAPAWSGLGDAYVQLGYASAIAPTDAFPKAREAAERAIALDATLAEPHATLALVHMYFDWDWQAAEREFTVALRLNPRYATAHEWYGLFLTAMGRFDAAREHERRAQTLDPLAPGTAATAAWVLYYSGRNADAARELDFVLRDHPTLSLAHLYRGRVAEAQHDTTVALRQYAATGPLSTSAVTLAARGHLLAVMGHAGEARRILAQLDSMSRSGYVTSYGVAIVHAGIGQRDSTFAWLDRAVQERTHWLVWLNRDPRWVPLHDDPRFRLLTMRLGLPD